MLQVDRSSSYKSSREDDRQHDKEGKRDRDRDQRDHRRDHSKDVDRHGDRSQRDRQPSRSHKGDDKDRRPGERDKERERSSKKRSRSHSRSQSRERPEKRSRHSFGDNKTGDSSHSRDSARREKETPRDTKDSASGAVKVSKEQEKENEEEFKKKVEEQLKSVSGETDEERLIRERRERRQAILAKYSKPDAQPSDNQTAEVKPEPMQIETKHETKAEPVANGVKHEGANGAANGHVKSELTMTQHVFDEISNDVPENAFNRKKVEEEEADSGIDMFAEDNDSSPEDDRVRKETKIKTLNVREADPSEDDQGYYRYRIGERLNNRFQVTGHHGKGVFSNVLSGIDETTGQTVAIKLLRNNDHMKRAGQKEMAILAQLSIADPEGRYNTIKLLDHFEDRDRLCLVFEPMEMNLRELVKKYGNRVGLGVKAVRVYAFKLFKALLLLKRNNIIHADLKPDNILVKDKSVVKLADLGSAYEYNALEPDTYNGYLVSRYYRAPEIILGNDYSFAIDVFSLGCTLYELARGKFMFQSKNNNHHLKLIMEAKGKFPKKMLQKGRLRPVHFDDNLNFKERLVDPVTNKIFEKIHTASIKQTRNIFTELLQSYDNEISEQEKKLVSLLADLIDKCTAIDPAKRITPDEALRHPFFTEFTKPPPPTAAPATNAVPTTTTEAPNEGPVTN